MVAVIGFRDPGLTFNGSPAGQTGPVALPAANPIITVEGVLMNAGDAPGTGYFVVLDAGGRRVAQSQAVPILPGGSAKLSATFVLFWGGAYSLLAHTVRTGGEDVVVEVRSFNLDFPLFLTPVIVGASAAVLSVLVLVFGGGIWRMFPAR